MIGRRKNPAVIATVTLVAYLLTGVIGGPAARYLCIEPHGRVTVEPFWVECCPSHPVPTHICDEHDCDSTVAEVGLFAEARTSGCEGCVDVPIPVDPHKLTASDDGQGSASISIHFAPLAFLFNHRFSTDGNSRPVSELPPSFALSLRAAILRC